MEKDGDDDDNNLDDQLNQGLVQIIRKEWIPCTLDEDCDPDGVLDMQSDDWRNKRGGTDTACRWFEIRRNIKSDKTSKVPC